MSTISREKGAIFCPIHPKKRLSFLCESCNILICNTCIIKEHFGHPVAEVEVVAEKTFRKIDDFITKVEKTTIPKAKENNKQIEAQVSAREIELEAGIEKAYQHEKYLIGLVKNNTHKTVNELKGEIKTIKQQLSQFKSESDTYLGSIENAVKECKETKKTKDDILLIDVFNRVEKIGDILPNCEILQTRKKFIPGLSALVDIANAFGCVSNDGDQASIGIQYTNEKKHQDLLSKGATAPIKGRQLLSNPPITQSKDLPSSYPCSIEKFSDNTLCYCCYNKSYVYLVDKADDIKTVNLDVPVCDIAIHPIKDKLYIVDPDDKMIRAVDIHTGATSVVLTTVDIPHCMTFTPDGNILVGFYEQNKVVQYTLKGQVLKSSNVTQPVHISVCDITGNIVIAGCKSGAHILNKDLQSMFVYKGLTEQQSTNKEPFYCEDAVFDTEGHLVISDNSLNGEVHVVDAGTGKHLKTITLDKFDLLYSLCLHKDGQLVVGTSGAFGTNKLVFVTYTRAVRKVRRLPLMSRFKTIV